MRRLLLSFLALGAFCAPAFADEPACGTVAVPKACASFTTGVVTVALRDSRREYATVGGIAEAPYAGFRFSGSLDAFAVQDGALADFGRTNAFRAVKMEAGVSKGIGREGTLRIQATGGTTLSIEGEVGAPLDPRQWDALLDVRLLVGTGGHIAIRGGHDGAVGGWAAGVDMVIPVKDGPALVARYELPLQRAVGGMLPWVITAGARVRVASFRLGK